MAVMSQPPMTVAYGMGVDSTAMLIGLQHRGVRPDLILFADTGGEKPETYAFEPHIQRWLRSVGFPPVVTVRYEPVRHDRYRTLEEKCLANETLPPPAFGFQRMNCSEVFKHTPQHKFIKDWQPAIDSWAAGQKVQKLIGYDAGPRDRTRTFKTPDDPKYEYVYPLIEWGWDREECKLVIAAEGLPVPPKSACFFCPASKFEEIEWLAKEHPDLFDRAVAMERGARDGRHGLQSTRGLGCSFSWEERIAEERRQGRLFV